MLQLNGQTVDKVVLGYAIMALFDVLGIPFLICNDWEFFV